jgi:hypothetical protein
MALPALVKTWQHNVNQAIAAQGTVLATDRLAWRTLKNSLIGFASNPWTVRGSSNSSAAAMDQVDRWVTDANLVWASGAHSWIVLRQTGIATNYELCIDLNSGTNGTGTIATSPAAGFTGGTVTARPTATDENVLISTNTIGGVNSTSTDNNVKLSVQQSTDGQCTRAQMWSQNIQTMLMVLDKPANPVTGWTNPSFSVSLGAFIASVGTLTNLVTTPVAKGKGASAMTLAMTLEGQATAGSLQTLLTSANDLSGSWPFLPIGMYSATALNRGRHGSFFDLWFGSSAVSNADTYPNDTSRQFAQLGALIFPWNGTTPLTT